MLFSVITAAFNRSHTLPALFHSLQRQQTELEWIVVDDGSTDGTKDLINDMAATADFRVSYLSQPNSGKHVAMNRGIAAARGEFAALADSDDTLLDGALPALHTAWGQIPPKNRDRYVGVTGRCTTGAEVLGSPIPGGHLDASWQEAQYRHRLRGERWGMQRLDVLLRHPFPERPDQRFVAEGAVWRAIGRNYLTRYIETPVRFYRTTGADQLTRKPFREVAAGQREWHLSVLREDIEFCGDAPDLVAASALHYTRASLHEGVPLRRQLSALGERRARVLCAGLLPAGVMFYLRDRLRARRTSRTSTSGPVPENPGT
ncbi:glycosyltransferase family A protein [Streptomyces sp. NPDC007861]|uniref:glycosyltransferase family 2 protein n=1 Tax=Streptomyces sp. NPDC007861 TaxID=3154893 RepID=UPI0033DEA50D